MIEWKEKEGETDAFQTAANRLGAGDGGRRKEEEEEQKEKVSVNKSKSEHLRASGPPLTGRAVCLA